MAEEIKNYSKIRDSNYFSIVEPIVQYIKDSGLRPGEKLKSESILAEILHINRSTLREGLRVAEAFGIIESKRGSGNIYTGDVEIGFMNLFMLQKILKDDAKMGVNNLRAVIEADAVEKFILNANEYDMFLLEMIYKEQMQSIKDKSRPLYLEYHILFHNQILKYNVNEMAQHIVRSGLRMVDNSCSKKFYAQKDTLTANEQRQLEKLQLASHENILNAIKEKDITQAKALLVMHIMLPGEIEAEL